MKTNLKRNEEIGILNKKKYEETYSIEQISINKTLNENDYFQKFVKIRLNWIKKYGQNKEVLDLCCGTGDYLLKSQSFIKRGIGVDFSQKMIKNAMSKKITNIEFMNCNAKQIPFKEKTFDLIYSFSSLYYIPEIEKVISEVSRLLKPGSVAILELGNLYSLNTITCKAYPEWATPCHITLKHMKQIVKEARLKIIEWKAFQILPFWGDNPKWLKPLLKPCWKIILQEEISGKMRDEWISELPLLRNFAFRQVVICKKTF
ncbi:MAG: class I SAM-dependent methyltransferase [bacterium]|nr:class I SAM-dependent methyltransferase [bacterium]